MSCYCSLRERKRARNCVHTLYIGGKHILWRARFKVKSPEDYILFDKTNPSLARILILNSSRCIFNVRASHHLLPNFHPLKSKKNKQIQKKHNRSPLCSCVPVRWNNKLYQNTITVHLHLFFLKEKNSQGVLNKSPFLTKLFNKFAVKNLLGLLLHCCL